jgi:flagellar basal body-associated protein FliL
MEGQTLPEPVMMDDEETLPSTRKRGLPMAVLVPVATLLLGAGGGFGAAHALDAPAAAATTAAGAPEDTPAAEPADDRAKADGEGSAAPKNVADGSAVTSLSSFTVNLRGSGGGRVLRLEVQVEGPAAQADVVAAHTPQIRDSIITAVSDYTWSELEGADGKTRLRDELLARVNGAVQPAVIDRIYFTQFVVQ